MGQIINGRKIAKAIRRELAETIDNEKIDAGLAAIVVGDDASSHMYVKLKAQAAEKIGMRFAKHELPETATTDEVLELVSKLNNDAATHGMIVQLPLPDQIDTDAVIAAINPNKDADGFQADSPLQPVMAQVVEEMLLSTQEELKGKRALILANTPGVFAPPVAELLAEHGIEPASATPDDTDVPAELKETDIVVIAIGRPHWLKPGMIKDGAILVDIGITKTDDGIQGDVDPACDDIADWRTRVPGGVGPVTVAILLRNTIECYRIQNDA